MNRLSRTGLLLLSILALSRGSAGAASEEGKAELKVATSFDVVYTKAGDAELKLDLAKPAEGDGPFPGVLVIHGGAWRAGSKADNRRLLEELAKHGYVAISPQYRFCPKEVFPAQVHDVKAAVRWLRSHAEEHKLDSDKIGAMGFSAGGHLSLMLGLTGPGDGLEGDVPADAPSSRVQVVVNFFGPTDLLASDIPDVSIPLVNDFVGGPREQKAELAKKASPLTYVSPDDAPILTFQGTKDPLVPHSQAIKLAEALSREGVPGRLELMVGAGHGWQGEDLAWSMRETVGYLDRYLKPKSK